MSEQAEIPAFRTKVPDNLRKEMTTHSRDVWLADTLSVIDQKLDWTMENLKETAKTAEESKETIDRWKSHIESPVKMLIVLLVYLAPWVLDRLFNHMN